MNAAIQNTPIHQETTAPQTIAELLATGKRLAGDGVALKLETGTALSHADLETLLVQAEQDLRTLGVGRRTRVVTALPDGALTACVLLALTRSAVCAPVNPDLRGAELSTLLPELAAEVLVAHGACAAEARKTAGALGIPVLEVSWNGNGGLTWSGAALANAPAPNDAASPDDPALILLTSGSSARPKRVPLTHRQLTLSAQRMAESIALTTADCCLNLMPMFHVGAVVDLLLAPLSVGGSVVRPETMSVPAFFAALAEFHPTWFQGVPTLLHELSSHALRERMPSAHGLRLIRSVSSPLPPEWLHEIESALGAPIIEIYGMTETAGVITSNPLPPAVRKVGSVGRAIGLEVEVQDADGASVAAGTRGEISVRGAGVMAGYENVTAPTQCLTADGWLRTGDEGYFDADGYLFITGRIGDQINRGGEKISPREIDEILLAHPAVAEAAAFPLPHPQLGQDVAAAVVLRAGETATAESLTQHVSQQLAYFKVPQAFYVVESLPRGPGGKLRRRLLPEMVRTLTPLQQAASDTTARPQSGMEQRVAQWWQEALGVSDVGRNADFFDLGGDSLAAASFTVGIEKLLGVTVRPAALFDHPTVTAFAAYLEQATGSATTAAPDSGIMKSELRQRLLAAMSVWPGVRRDEFSLLVGVRTEGTGLPLFWCGQGRPEFDVLVEKFPPEHPIYATRSLYLFDGKTKDDEAALAQLFAQEVETLRAGREVLVGGFCAGGRIAFQAACHLRERGVPVRMVFMHEAWPTQPIDVPVALGFGTTYEFSPYRTFHRPEFALRKRYPAGWKLWLLDVPHADIYGHPLTGEVAKLKALWEDPAGFNRPPALEEVPGTAYRAQLKCSWRTPMLGRTGWARVKITNLSNHTWAAAERSGLHLGQRWLNADGQPLGDPSPSVPLPRTVPAGGSISLTVKFTAPQGSSTLEIDMVDEGIQWFSAKKSQQPSVSLKLHFPKLADTPSPSHS